MEGFNESQSPRFLSTVEGLTFLNTIFTTVAINRKL